MRFPEFSGEWEMSSIGEQFELYSGNTPSRMNKNQFDGSINWITSGELKEHYISDTKEKISEEAAKNNSLKLLPVGTFVIAIYGLEANGVRGTCSITTRESTISQACMAFTSKMDIQNEFLYSWYKKHGNIIGIKYAQGTKQQNLSYDIIERFNISYPCMEEQKKLIRFISLIDQRIATQNKIIEDLKKLKCAIIDYTFDNKTQSHRKRILLSDVSAKITRRNTDNQNFNVLSNSANQGIIPQNEVFDREIANENNTSNYFVISQNDFVYNPRKSVTAPYGPINRYNGETNGVISPLYLCFRCYGIDVEYLGWYFKSDSWHKYVYQNGDTGVRHDRVSIKDEIFFSMPLYLHSTEEQMEIAKRLNKIESFVSQEEKYLFLLRSQKLYLLQQMFI